jgi:hypothetical protein
VTNVPANTITALVNPVSGISVTNQSSQAIVAGANAETETQTQARLANTVNSIHRGDAQAIEVGLLNPSNTALTDSSGNITEEITKALALDFSAGNAYIYIYDGTTASASSALISLAQKVVNGYTDVNGVVHIGYKSAGVIATVYAAILNPVNVSVAVLPSSGYTLSMVTSAVTSAINSFFSALDINDGVSLTLLLSAIVKVPGVSDAQLSTPTTALTGTPNIVDPTAAPTLTAESGSTSLAAGTYYVSYAYVGQWGTTAASPTQNVTITAGQSIQVSALTLPTGATSIYYYLSQAAGSTTVLYDAQGTGSVITLTALPASGAAAAPTANTAVINGNLYTAGTITVTQLS